MQKTKLEITVGLLGAAMYLTCLFSGYLAAIPLAGYILLFEENAWLRKTAVKGVVLLFAFGLLTALIEFIPDIIYFVDRICNIFKGSFDIRFLSALISALTLGLSILEKVLFIILGLKALNQGTIAIPVVDSLINKYMD